MSIKDPSVCDVIVSMAFSIIGPVASNMPWVNSNRTMMVVFMISKDSMAIGMRR